MLPAAPLALTALLAGAPEAALPAPAAEATPAPAPPKLRAMTLEEQRAAVRQALGVGPRPTRGIAPNSVRLFDAERAVYGLEVRVGGASFRRSDERERGFQKGAYTVEIGATNTSRWRGLYLNGTRKTSLRVLDSKSWLWTVLGHEIAAGVALGPVEVESRLGFTLLNIDRLRGDGWNVSTLSPHVGVDAAVAVGPIRIEGGLSSEYYWRFFGPSVLLNGAHVGLRLNLPRPRGDLLSPTPSAQK